MISYYLGRRNSADSVSQLHDLSEQFSSNRDHTFHSSHKPGKSSGIFVPGAPQCMCMRVGLSIQSAVWCFPNSNHSLRWRCLRSRIHRSVSALTSRATAVSSCRTSMRQPAQARAYLLILANEHRPSLVFSPSGMPVSPANHKKILMAHRRFSMIIFIVLPRFVGDLL